MKYKTSDGQQWEVDVETEEFPTCCGIRVIGALCFYKLHNFSSRWGPDRESGTDCVKEFKKLTTKEERDKIYKKLFAEIAEDYSEDMYTISTITPRGLKNPYDAFYNSDAPHVTGCSLWDFGKANGFKFSSQRAVNRKTGNIITIGVKSLD